MNKRVKQRIQRLWRNRVLLGLGGVFAIGLAGFQLHALFQSRPQQPAWVLELSHSLEALSENKTDEERKTLIVDIQGVARNKSLLATEFFALALERELELELSLEPLRALELSLGLARALELELVPKLVRTLVLARELERTLERAQTLELERTLERALELEQMLELERNSLLVAAATAELADKHGRILQQGDELENLLNNESRRAHAFVQIRRTARDRRCSVDHIFSRFQKVRRHV